MDLVKRIAPFVEVIAVLNLAIVLALDSPERDLSLLTILTCAVLSLLYFFMAFTTYDDQSPVDVLIQKVNNIGLAVLVTGFLFTIQHYPGAPIQLKIGSITVLIGLVGTVFLRKNEFSSFSRFKLPLLRNSIALLISLALQV